MYDIYGFKSTSLLFEDGEKYCRTWYFSYFFTEYINFILAAFIAVVNYIVQQTFEEIGKKRITKNVSDNHEFRMLSVACLQYFNMQTALIMAYMNFEASENLRLRSQSQSSFEISTH